MEEIKTVQPDEGTAILEFLATGRRKTAVARVRLKPGQGNIFINHRPVDEYFPRRVDISRIRKPFELTATANKFDTHINVRGGGLTGQSGAILHGIARALLRADGDLRSALSKAGLLTRDARMVERKKYGQPGARKRFQFSKR
ncbi:30S ribosomal protein S9 [bacterium]|nr:30S ribosomal protein S9 [bacterium]